jgi:hypothetical protein
MAAVGTDVFFFELLLPFVITAFEGLDGGLDYWAVEGVEPAVGIAVVVEVVEVVFG